MAVSPRMGRAKNCIGVVVDKNAEGFSGHVTNRYQKDSVEFTDLPELFSRIIEVLDTLNYPARKINKRQFKGGVLPADKFKINEDQGPIVDTADLLGGKDGFIIMALGRDNGTIQGTVYDSALDKDFKFNGDIELYRILYKK